MVMTGDELNLPPGKSGCNLSYIYIHTDIWKMDRHGVYVLILSWYQIHRHDPYHEDGYMLVI